VTLQVEVNIMPPGKGVCSLTGQLGDVMKESAETGVSYVRSIAPENTGSVRISLRNMTFTCTFPEGAVPKDGPSAGITMATAILSAVTKVPVRADLAMTGEITLRGRVLPIGGLKEKLLAAKKAGIRTVLVPAKNEPDVSEFDSEITDGLEIRLRRDGSDEVLVQPALSPGETERRCNGRKEAPMFMKIKNVNLEIVCGVTSRLPDTQQPEIAFAGKSNVGKSSLINALVNRKALARTSSNPGKTQTINFYHVNDAFYLVDLPGYGYASASQKVRESWGKMVERYLNTSQNLRDRVSSCRHPARAVRQR
jgi:hypothetical protein